MFSNTDENYLKAEGITDEQYGVEMDEIVLLHQDGQCKYFNVEDNTITFSDKQNTKNIKSLYTLGVGACIAIYADWGMNSTQKILAHVTPEQSINNVIEGIHKIATKNLQTSSQGQNLNFYIFGGTQDSIRTSIEQDGQWIYPSNCNGETFTSTKF